MTKRNRSKLLRQRRASEKFHRLLEENEKNPQAIAAAHRDLVNIESREGWGRGPWRKEPNRKEFRRHGLPCLIVRNDKLGHLCGYVAVPPGHPWHGKGYDEIDPEVHGGLTYASQCNERICHVPRRGEPDNVWWLGFDCAHAGDLSPAIKSHRRGSRWPRFAMCEVYRTMSYVMDECARLALQASDAAI